MATYNFFARSVIILIVCGLAASESVECQNDIDAYVAGLQNGEGWALKSKLVNLYYNNNLIVLFMSHTFINDTFILRNFTFILHL